MAQLNDTMVQGDLRVTGTMYGTLSGNAITANNATNDSDGSKINTTYLKRSGGELTGTITRAFASSSSSTVSETSILEVTGSTDGFKITYQASTADLGITRFGTTDDVNAKLSLGNWTSSSTYQEAISIVNGSATVTGSLSGNASTATTATYSNSTKVTTAATTKGYLTAANASGYSSGSNTTLFVDKGVYLSTNTGELVATTFTGTNLSISGPSALQGGVGISVDNAKSLTIIDTRSTAKPSIFSVGIANSNPIVSVNAPISTDNSIECVSMTAANGIQGASVSAATGEFSTSLTAHGRPADGSISTVNTQPDSGSTLKTIIWGATTTHLLLVDQSSATVKDVIIDVKSLVTGLVYWLHFGRGRKIGIKDSNANMRLFVYGESVDMNPASEPYWIQDNIGSDIHGNPSIAVIRANNSGSVYVLMNYGLSRSATYYPQYYVVKPDWNELTNIGYYSIADSETGTTYHGGEAGRCSCFVTSAHMSNSNVPYIVQISVGGSIKTRIKNGTNNWTSWKDWGATYN